MKRIKAKTVYLIVVIVLSAAIFSSAAFAQIKESHEQTDLSTSITFVTDQPDMFRMLERLEMIFKEQSLLGEHHCSFVGFGQMHDRLASYDVMNSGQLDLAEGATIVCDYELLGREYVAKSLQGHVDHGRSVILFGDGIDLERFCTLFNLTDCLPKASDEKKSDDDGSDNPSPASHLIAVGVESADWGQTLITVHDSSYDDIRAIDLSITNAIHSKKIRMNKPYDHSAKPEAQAKSAFSSLLSGEKVAASGYDSFPIVNSQRNTASGTGCYTLITDGYLHRIQPEYDTEYDYFILETISELIHIPPARDKNRIRTRLTAAYSDDKVRSGGPAAQGPTTNQTISVNFAPPSISYSFSTSNNAQIYTALSISNRYYETTYVDHEYPPIVGFLDTSHFTTALSYATYAPSSAYTYTKVNIVQRLGDGLFWTNYFNPWVYYYNY